MAARTAAAGYTDEDVKRALLAVIAWGGSYTAAIKDLEDREPPLYVPVSTLQDWCRKTYVTEYHRLRDEHAPQLEKALAHEFTDVAAKAVEVQRLGLLKAEQRLAEDRDDDPAKTAAFAARVGGTAVEKLRTLTDRPERITENRDVNEVLRSLAAKKVVFVDSTATEEPQQLASGAAEEEPAPQE